MDIISLLLIAVGLSMDAFAVSICKGLCMKSVRAAHAVAIALAFGLFQAGMPLVGWLLGIQFQSYITAYDHWVAFALLAFIGGKMLADGLKGSQGDACPAEYRFDVKELLTLAVATSIDALAVGVTFAFLPGTAIAPSVAAIGATTFGFSLAGVWIGHRFGRRHERRATLAGGVILVGIGVKILVEHLLG